MRRSDCKNIVSLRLSRIRKHTLTPRGVKDRRMFKKYIKAKTERSNLKEVKSFAPSVDDEDD